MAQKDASLGNSQLISEGFFITHDSSGASYEITLASGTRPADTQRTLVIVGTTAAGSGVATYRMRGFDQNVSVNDIVYWTSTDIDSTATNYLGSAGPVVDIVVYKIL